MSSFNTQDCVHMARALQLAERGRFSAHPNPVVGCVLVRKDKVVGEGFHERTGEAHAEINALEAAGAAARGATAYVTLEPCAHHGRTPPCTDALVEAGVSRVVVALEDPNPAVAGRGLQQLRDAGIEVQTGLMQSAAAALNRGFLMRVTRKKPLLRLKLACSIDGAIAMDTGESQWISGPAARQDVQRLRARSGAVMTGIGTVLTDDPSLTVRAAEFAGSGLQPVRVVVDTHLRMPPAAKMLALPGTTLICHASDNATEALVAAGAEVLGCRKPDGRVDLSEVLEALAGRGINELLVEAGPTLAGSLLEKGLVDELVIYQAPHIMGSRTKGLVETPSWTALADRSELEITEQRRIGDDTRITARVGARKEPLCSRE